MIFDIFQNIFVYATLHPSFSITSQSYNNIFLKQVKYHHYHYITIKIFTKSTIFFDILFDYIS